MNRIVSFRQMKDGTREDYLLLEEYERDYVRLLPQRILASLRKLGNSFEGYPVTRLEHSLQCATRAHAAGAMKIRHCREYTTFSRGPPHERAERVESCPCISTDRWDRRPATSAPALPMAAQPTSTAMTAACRAAFGG